MKVTFVGFGGIGTDYPVYKDEKGRLYFDLGNCDGELKLNTGAYIHPEDGDITGEPCCLVTEEVECDNPYIRHPRTFDYQMLGRLKSDCEYFLGNGNGYLGHLYYKDVNKHCDAMLSQYNSFSDKDKPVWLSVEKIENYRKEMLALAKPA